MQSRDFMSHNIYAYKIILNIICLAEMEIVRDIKEKLCYTALDYNEHLASPHRSVTFDLPDGTSISMDSERFRAPEIMFTPSLQGN